MPTAIELFQSVRKLIRNPEHWDKWAPAAYWEPAGRNGPAGWRSCTCEDPAAKRFTLFGAIWRTVPGSTEEAKARNYKRFVQIFEAGALRHGIRLRPEEGITYQVWSGNNVIDNWANKADRTHDEVMAALKAVIDILIEEELNAPTN